MGREIPGGRKPVAAGSVHGPLPGATTDISSSLRHGGRPGLRLGVAVLLCCAGAGTATETFRPLPPSVLDVELMASDALIMAGTDMHIVDQSWMDMAIRNYIQPTLGGDYTSIPVTTPAQFWPFSGPEDMLFDLSVRDGTTAIGAAVDAQQHQAGQADAPTVVFGYSQSAVIATGLKRRLAADATTEADSPAVSFVMLANLNRPNGGLNSRFAGAFIEELGWTFSAAAPTDTPFQTIDVARQYDIFADFPRYPLNVLATANAIVALLYGAHDYSGVTLNTADPGYDPNTVVQQEGDTTYYFIPASVLPLLRPLRDMGFDSVLLDAAEPALRVLVEFGYDRATPLGQPAPALLTPREDFDQLNLDLTAAVEQGRSILEAVPAASAPTPPPPPRWAARDVTTTIPAPGDANQVLRTNPAAVPPRRDASPAGTEQAARSAADAARPRPADKTAPQTGPQTASQTGPQTASQTGPQSGPRTESATVSRSRR